MAETTFTVVIPTYNRADLVVRAIQSALIQQFQNLEIIVVDDTSTDETPEMVQRLYPQVRYLRQDHNQGPGPARNRGIQEASNPYVVLLDDDDTLLPEALSRIAAQIETLPNLELYPVLQFAHSNGSIPEPFLLISLDHYLWGVIQGDFIPVIRRNRFLELGLAYPEVRIGAEHLLWWHIAAQYGIPTWATVIASVHADAPSRLTRFQHQIDHAREYAQAQELTLEYFGQAMRDRAPVLYFKKRLGAATYLLLAGERTLARMRLRERFTGRFATYAFALRGLSYMPNFIIRSLFRCYRRLST